MEERPNKMSGWLLVPTAIKRILRYLSFMLYEAYINHHIINHIGDLSMTERSGLKILTELLDYADNGNQLEILIPTSENTELKDRSLPRREKRKEDDTNLS